MRLAASKGYLGLGAQRKGQDLSNIIVGWFSYEGPVSKPKLTFNGCDSKNIVSACEVIHKLAGLAELQNAGRW